MLIQSPEETPDAKTLSNPAPSTIIHRTIIIAGDKSSILYIGCFLHCPIHKYRNCGAATCRSSPAGFFACKLHVQEMVLIKTEEGSGNTGYIATLIHILAILKRINTSTVLFFFFGLS
jgi:hypothetical protein